MISANFYSSAGELGYNWAEANGQVYIGQVEFTSVATGTSSNGVNVELLGPPLLYTTAILTWQLGLYSQTTGYPSCGCWSDGRLWLGGVLPNRFDASCPNGNTGASITFSPTDQYNNVTDGSAISEVFSSDSTNEIYWMQAEQQGIICGTPGGEFLIFAPSTAAGISALNIDSKRVTKIRCANILPARCEHTNVLVQLHQRKLMEYFPDIFSGKFTAPNLAEKWKHLTVSGIAEIAYQQELAPVVWMRLNNGSLIGATYKRDTLMTSSGPTFIAAHNHPLGSGNMVVSITSGPSEDGELDALSAVTLDSAGLYHVETLADLYEEGDTIPDAWFLDEATTPTSFTVGSTSITLNGLWYLNGQTCTAFLNGLDCGDWPVSNGSMTVNFYGQTGQTETQLTAALRSRIHNGHADGSWLLLHEPRAALQGHRPAADRRPHRGLPWARYVGSIASRPSWSMQWASTSAPGSRSFMLPYLSPQAAQFTLPINRLMVYIRTTSKTIIPSRVKCVGRSHVLGRRL